MDAKIMMITAVLLVMAMLANMIGIAYSSSLGLFELEHDMEVLRTQQMELLREKHPFHNYDEVVGCLNQTGAHFDRILPYRLETISRQTYMSIHENFIVFDGHDPAINAPTENETALCAEEYGYFLISYEVGGQFQLQDVAEGQFRIRLAESLRDFDLPVIYNQSPLLKSYFCDSIVNRGANCDDGAVERNPNFQYYFDREHNTVTSTAANNNMTTITTTDGPSFESTSQWNTTAITGVFKNDTTATLNCQVVTPTYTGCDEGHGFGTGKECTTKSEYDVGGERITRFVCPND